MDGVNKYIAEVFGTAVLVMMGCGAVVLSTGAGAGTAMSLIGIAFAFGLAQMAMCYSIGRISGSHINPAVTIGFLSAGRIGIGDAVGYIISQCIGAIIGAAVLYVLLSDKIGGYDVAASGLGQNGWGEGYGAGYGLMAAAIVEVIATFIFVYLILQVTKPAVNAAVAGMAIGLTLLVIHVVFINVTGVSVNPARSLGPALFVGGKAVAQLWLFIAAPVVGAIIAGLVSRAGPEEV